MPNKMTLTTYIIIYIHIYIFDLFLHFHNIFYNYKYDKPQAIY
jgi:hypothetical protein